MSTETKDRPNLRRLSRGDAIGIEPTSRIPPPRFNWKTRLLLPGAILGLAALLLGYTARDALWPSSDLRVIPVVVKTNVASSGAMVVQAPGWVEPDPYPIAVPALTNGVVKQVLVLEGQAVKVGDVVAVLIDDDAKIELAKAEAQLAEMQAALDAAQRNWDNPIERTRAVASTQAQVAELEAQLQRNLTEIDADAARVEMFAIKFHRARQSRQSNAATEVELIEAEQEHKAQQAVLQATRAQRNVLEAQLQQRQADLEAAKRNLDLRIEETQALAAAKAAVAMARARVDEARLRLERTQIRSPANGIVMNLFVEPGSKLVMDMDDPHSAHVVRLYDPARLQVRVDVPLSEAAKVGVGQAATIVVGVLPDTTFHGRITRIVNEADIQKNTLQVKVAIDDPTPQLKPEMLARARFLTQSESAGTGDGTAQVLFVPQNLVHRSDSGQFIWVADAKRNVATRRTIQVGQSNIDGWIDVTDGVRPGDLLIAEPVEMREGMKIKVQGEAKGADHAAH